MDYGEVLSTGELRQADRGVAAGLCPAREPFGSRNIRAAEAATMNPADFDS